MQGFSPQAFLIAIKTRLDRGRSGRLVQQCHSAIAPQDGRIAAGLCSGM
jgi:hypothetical protein